MNKAVFLDRDGVLNVDRGYTHRPTELEWLPGVPEALRSLHEAGYLLLVVTNQSGVARGMYQLEDVYRFHDYMQQQLSAYRIAIDQFYICPHHPDFSGPCACRKPATGLVKQAIKEHDLAIGRSFFVGDKRSDIDCAIAAGCPGIQVISPATEHHPSAWQSCQSLRDATRLILSS